MLFGGNTAQFSITDISACRATLKLDEDALRKLWGADI